MNRPVLVLAVALLLGLLGGCATPESRIRQNPEFFASLPPPAQELIRRGQVDIGFTPDMIRLALGEPDTLTIRTNADGRSEVWHYVIYDTLHGDPLYRGWYHRHVWRDPLYPYYLDVAERRERERLSLVIKNGAIIEIEHEVARR